MSTTYLQNTSWRSLPEETKIKIRGYYNEDKDTLFRVFNDLFGIENLDPSVSFESNPKFLPGDMVRFFLLKKDDCNIIKDSYYDSDLGIWIYTLEGIKDENGDSIWFLEDDLELYTEPVSPKFKIGDEVSTTSGKDTVIRVHRNSSGYFYLLKTYRAHYYEEFLMD